MSEGAPGAASLEFAEALWDRYREDPGSVSLEWRRYFERLEAEDRTGVGRVPEGETGREQLRKGAGPGGSACAGCGRAEAMSLLQHNVSQLIRNYRVRGHRAARVDPLGAEPPRLPELEPEYYGIPPGDMDLLFSAGSIAPEGPVPLAEIISRLEETYCGAIGVQYMHIDDVGEREWLQDRMEPNRNRIRLDLDRQMRILARLSDAVNFEQFLQKKFIGAKSFSLEGAESLIPLLDMSIEKAGAQGVEKIVIGMPHRGRLNVLANIMGKRASRIFGEFKDADAARLIGRGDVKYHLGYDRKWRVAAGGEVDLELVFNPSHLEFVGPVAQGRTRAWMERHGDDGRDRAMLLLVHGDAAIAGEGIVQETFNLSEIDGYSVGGAVHVVVNNQIGFTTLASEGRSSVYASDIAKVLQGPVFHVNGENPEAVAQALEVALDFRREFSRDVVIDMYCYRRRGHNESDEPTFTQPLMYKKIAAMPNVFDSYTDHLIGAGEISREQATAIFGGRLERLQREFDSMEKAVVPLGFGRPSKDAEEPSNAGEGDREIDTGIGADRVLALMERLTAIPEGFNPHRKIGKILQGRMEMARGERDLDWGAAESLALASLAQEGVEVRLSGQDSQRGTFSHRHSVLHDVDNGSSYMPLSSVSPDQARVTIINSPLSEGAVLGFEYGYSLARERGLFIWEAQFGDFANAAQVYIDQFITAGEQKWRQRSALVMLLPHGLEGTGPEHASARLERFLAAAARKNMRIASPTTPAQFFHLLRKQAISGERKPLIVMSPKSMLRHRDVISAVADLAHGGFQKILPDEMDGDRDARRVILCNGKIYYELAAARERDGRDDVAILRIEQLYPLSAREIEAALGGYEEGKDLLWVQEEPLNMGGARFMQERFARVLGSRWPLRVIGRPRSPSPATGSAASHRLEQERIIELAFAQRVDQEC